MNHYLILLIIAIIGTSIFVAFNEKNPTNLFCLQEANAQCSPVYYPQQHYYDGILQLYAHKPGGPLWSLEGNWSNNRPINSGGEVYPIGGGWYRNTGNINN